MYLSNAEVSIAQGCERYFKRGYLDLVWRYYAIEKSPSIDHVLEIFLPAFAPIFSVISQQQQQKMTSAVLTMYIYFNRRGAFPSLGGLV